ncbi:hypothetical protein PTKIN_Ptkin03bG0037100 [Pterospermum kingtungense]
MAQLDPMHRYDDNPKSTPNPAVDQLIRVRVGEDQVWSPSLHSSSPMSGRSHEVQDPEDIQYNSKKSTVLSKVKEKARRWRQGFIKKKHGEGDNTTPSWGFRFEDDENYEDEDPEYFGAPMYESELAPEGYKENARQHPRASPVIPETHVLASNIKPVSKPESGNAKETSTTETIASKIQGLFVSSPTGPNEKDTATQETDKHVPKTGNPISPMENKWDKGVSVKEYIMNKFEPGEDEKALSQVISDVMSPRRSPGDVGVVKKVRGVVNSLLWRSEEAPQSTNINHSDANSTPHIPISTNATAGNFHLFFLILIFGIC